MKWLCIVILFLFSCSSAPVQPGNGNTVSTQPDKVNLNIKLQDAPASGTLLLYRFYFDKMEVYDSLSITDGMATLTLAAPYTEGLYAVRIPGAKMAPFIIGRVDKQISLSSSYNALSNGVWQKINSKENEAYDKLMSLAMQRDAVIDSMKRNVSAVSRISKNYYAAKATQRMEILNKIIAYYPAFDSISDLYPGSYTTTILLPMVKRSTRLDNETFADYDNDHAYEHDHYFDTYNMNDERILTHPLLITGLRNYLEESIGEFDEDYKQAVDYIGTRSNNETVKNLLVNYTIRYFISLPNDNIAQYAAQKYIPGCSDDYIEVLKKQTEFVRGPAVGENAPDFAFEASGKKNNLNATITGSRITVLFIWKSTCDHCREEIPRMKRLYELYGNKGLSIVSVSLDKDMDAYNSFMAEEKFTWLHTHESFTDNTFSQKYPTASTPAVYAINTKGKVIAQNIGGKVLEQAVKALITDK